MGNGTTVPSISIAAFHPKCSLKRVNVQSKDKHVLYYNDLQKCIESYTEAQLTNDEVSTSTKQYYERTLWIRILKRNM